MDFIFNTFATAVSQGINEDAINFRGLFLAWALLSLVFGTVYKGMVVKEFAAPSMWAPPENIYELIKRKNEFEFLAGSLMQKMAVISFLYRYII